MHIRLLDLDGSFALQTHLHNRYQPAVHEARDWGRRIRLGCGFGRFRQFENALDGMCADEPPGPVLTFYGSGDFHHVSLALVRRLRQPFNLLVLDNHPDWMRGIPFLHCGTWLYHAARLPQVQRIFHVGGDVDFDNGFRWLAPWSLLKSGKIQVFPSVRSYHRGRWGDVPHCPVRPQPHEPTSASRLAELLEPYRFELRRWPLYISLDKDVMVDSDAVVNWDSGKLTLPEVAQVLQAFAGAADGRLAGVDIVGDWSPVRLQGWLRRVLHWTEHPPLDIEELRAVRCNERTNLALLNTLGVRPGVAGRPLAVA
jgi:hypothetical protein